MSTPAFPSVLMLTTPSTYALTADFSFLMYIAISAHSAFRFIQAKRTVRVTNTASANFFTKGFLCLLIGLLTFCIRGAISFQSMAIKHEFIPQCFLANLSELFSPLAIAVGFAIFHVVLQLFSSTRPE